MRATPRGQPPVPDPNLAHAGVTPTVLLVAVMLLVCVWDGGVKNPGEASDGHMS